MSRHEAHGTRQTADSPEAEAQLRALLELVLEQCGMDFRDYAQASLLRRVLQTAGREHCASIADLHSLVAGDAQRMQRLLSALTIPVTSMFRDPEFFVVLRRLVLPLLRTYPFLRVWIAGCSSGEEVYSLAILLHEAGLYQRCRIYATDISESSLDKAKEGIFPLASMQTYTRNYQRAGGESSLADYYLADAHSVIFRPFLKSNIVFAVHNLAGDASFNEFHAIFCRNVMIYFNRSLQDRVHRLLCESLVVLGYLGLGRSESLRFSGCEANYETISAPQRVYRRIR